MAASEPLRLAVYHTDLERDGPGLLLRDILRGDDPQIDAVIDEIATARADILLLLDFDYDAEHRALNALADRLAALGHDYPHQVSLRPNTGLATGLDIDGDGRLAEPEDSHGHGLFAGQGGMALLSRFPVDEPAILDFTDLLWRDGPGARPQDVLPREAADTLRLFGVGAWRVPVMLPSGTRLDLLALHASAPVFDGPEDRNGQRNADQMRFVMAELSRDTSHHLAVIGTLNIDPEQGEGRRGVLSDLLNHPELQDPRPERPGGGTQTVDWPEPRPGDLRVDYILPSANLTVLGSGVQWPEAE
ncbi:MAG: endonuclease/exonuclease/phosphatase family protein, partial [Pseudomonadota bacterium]